MQAYLDVKYLSTWPPVLRYTSTATCSTVDASHESALHSKATPATDEGAKVR